MNIAFGLKKKKFLTIYFFLFFLFSSTEQGSFFLFFSFLFAVNSHWVINNRDKFTTAQVDQLLAPSVWLECTDEPYQYPPELIGQIYFVIAVT